MDKDSLEFLVEASKTLNSTLDLDALLGLISVLVEASVDAKPAPWESWTKRETASGSCYGWGELAPRWPV